MFEKSHIPSEEFLGVGSGDGEGDDGPVNAALADEGVFRAESQVRSNHLVTHEHAIGRTQTWNRRNQTYGHTNFHIHPVL